MFCSREFTDVKNKDKTPRTISLWTVVIDRLLEMSGVKQIEPRSPQDFSEEIFLISKGRASSAAPPVKESVCERAGGDD